MVYASFQFNSKWTPFSVHIWKFEIFICTHMDDDDSNHHKWSNGYRFRFLLSTRLHFQLPHSSYFSSNISFRNSSFFLIFLTEKLISFGISVQIDSMVKADFQFCLPISKCVFVLFPHQKETVYCNFLCVSSSSKLAKSARIWDNNKIERDSYIYLNILITA